MILPAARRGPIKSKSVDRGWIGEACKLVDKFLDIEAASDPGYISFKLPGIYCLTKYYKYAYHKIPDKAKPALRRGRKATGLYEIAGLPGKGSLAFFLETNCRPYNFIKD